MRDGLLFVALLPHPASFFKREFLMVAGESAYLSLDLSSCSPSARTDSALVINARLHSIKGPEGTLTRKEGKRLYATPLKPLPQSIAGILRTASFIWHRGSSRLHQNRHLRHFHKAVTAAFTEIKCATRRGSGREGAGGMQGCKLQPTPALAILAKTTRAGRRRQSSTGTAERQRSAAAPAARCTPAPVAQTAGHLSRPLCTRRQTRGRRAPAFPLPSAGAADRDRDTSREDAGPGRAHSRVEDTPDPLTAGR
ncbi:hypothetical protein SKAU_G00310960 [Synaphobranchus kaupii]|uniref:Uncharacterized protein n=1 Tax=Synaphobranchus kaupii TaxID=118154 RepID=A0A9Q1IL86_SYNKA|nr:hypothetical protein SKAU_G00310960 [Synaphobranchus kaupii]